MAIEIVDLPIEHGVIFHSFLLTFTRGYTENLEELDFNMDFLAGGFKHFLFSIIYGIFLPIDFHIFQDG